MKKHLGALPLGALLAPSGLLHAADFADQVVSYVQGSGSNASFKTPGVALGAPVSGKDGSTPYSVVHPASLKKHLFSLALLVLASLARVQADTSYLLIQGPFGSGGAEQTFKWQVNYRTGQLTTGLDLLSAVFGSPSHSGSFNDDFGGTYDQWVAGNGTQGMSLIDFNNNNLSAPFTISFTLASKTVVMPPDYSLTWSYYVAGGGSNLGNGYDNAGNWTFSQDGSLARTLVDGSFDSWVFGDFTAAIDGAGNTPTTSNFSGATVINVPEPTGAAMLVFGAGGLALFRRRRV